MSAEGVILWRAPIGREPSRPAIDRHGVVWTATADAAFGVTPDGRVAYRRGYGDGQPSLLPTVHAVADGVLVQDGRYAVQFAARPTRVAGPRPSLRVAPAAFGLREEPIACAAPPEGRPRTCFNDLRSGASARLVVPADSTVSLTIRSSAGGPVLARLGPYGALTGGNLIRLAPFLAAGRCPPARLCYAQPGRYILTARVAAGGRVRTLRTTFRLIPSTGRARF